MNQDLLLRTVGWTVNRLGLVTILAAALLMTALGSVVFGMAEVVRGQDFGLLLAFSILGLILAWILARSRLSGPAAGVLILAAGFLLVVARIGRLEGPSFALIEAWIRVILHGWPWNHADWTPFLRSLMDLWEPLRALQERLALWGRGLFGGESVIDPASTALVWGWIFWAVSAWAGWSVRRWREPFLGALPAGALLAGSLNFAHAAIASLLVFIGAIWLLKVVIDLSERQRDWTMRGIDYPDDTLADLAVVSIALTMALVSAAALAPSLSISKISDLLESFRPPQPGPVIRAGESLGLKQQPVAPRPLSDLYAPGLPRSHLLGSGPELSQEIVMTVRTGELAPNPASVPVSQPVPRYYWRGLTFDRYTGRGWVTTVTNTYDYKAEQDLQAAELPNHRLVRQDIQLVGKPNPTGNVLYIAGELVTANPAYKADWRPGPPRPVRPAQGSAPVNESDSDLFGASIQATSYPAESLVPIASEEQLRSAGEDYPDWIRKRYLALPDSVPVRVLSLARDLTATQATPYDRARAIEAYLRTFPYSLKLPQPPGTQDVADFFLFDLKRGYCDYYATAMVVLARAAGLPARLVMGYASGQYDPLNARYIVTEADAHSWPEIYFPGYGWIEFEPTASQPSIERPSGAEASQTPEPLPGEDSSTGGGFRPRISWDWLAWIKWIPPLLGAVLISGLLALAIDLLRLRILPPQATLATLFRRLYQQGRPLAVPSRRGDTPYEYTASFANRLATLSKGYRWRRLLAPPMIELRRLADLYVQALYSPTPINERDRAEAVRAWSRLGWRLWLARFLT